MLEQVQIRLLRDVVGAAERWLVTDASRLLSCDPDSTLFLIFKLRHVEGHPSESREE